MRTQDKVLFDQFKVKFFLVTSDKNNVCQRNFSRAKLLLNEFKCCFMSTIKELDVFLLIELYIYIYCTSHQRNKQLGYKSQTLSYVSMIYSKLIGTERIRFEIEPNQ